MTPWRRLLGPGLGTAAMLVVLCGLGVWQVQRLHWKTALLARIDAAEAAPGIPLPAHPAAFQKVRVIGRLRPGATARYGVEVRDTPPPQGSVLGSQIVAVLDRTGAPSVLVLLGWVPSDRTPPLRGSDQVIDGYVHPPARAGLFSATDDIASRQFYTLDPQRIGHVLGAASVLPDAIVAMGRPEPGVYPQPATSMPRPPNDHLSYAITWFGLAATLLAVFAAYARKVLTP